MTFLRLLTWPYVRKHKLRALLTLTGIILGVAVFTGMHTANQAVSRAFQQTVDRIAGKAQLQVSAGETGFPEDVLEKVQSLGTVRAAAPVVEAVLNTGLPGEGNLLVLGVDMTGDRSLRDYDLEGQDDDVIDDPLIFLAQPDSLILSKPFADRNGIKRNQKITFQTMQGPRVFTVRGIMKPGGLASAFGGNLAVMDVYAAQMIFGRGRMFDRIDIGAAEGVSVDTARKELETLLGAGFQVEPPATRGQHFEAIARSLSITINITSLLALLIGIFIIYNSFSIAITQRRGEIGILRALGATQHQVLGMFLLESAAAGLAGSLIGLWAGIGLARGITPVLSTMVRELYGTAQMADDTTPAAALIVAAIGIGILASVAGGYLPARAAASVDPVKALQKGRYQVLSEGENRMRRAVALVLLGLSLGGFTFFASGIFYYIGFALCVVAVLLLAPALSLALSRALRPALKWLRPVEGALAADSLIQAPRRTSATVSAVMLSLALAVGFAGISNAIFGSVSEWMEYTFNPDLFVAPTETITSRHFRFPITMLDEIRAIEGVDEVAPVRNARVMVKGEPAMAIGLPIAHLQRRVPVHAVEGDPKEMLRRARAGEGVIVSENLANIRGLHMGTMFEVDTPTGRHQLPVLGVVIDYSDQQGTFFIERELYVRYWRDDTVNVFRIFVKPGVAAASVRSAILAKLGSNRRLFVLTNRELKDFVLNLTKQWFGMTYIQMAVALLVAILGIVNTLTVSITDRRRELGVLQAVGGMRNQIRHTIWLEALAIGFAAAVLGCVLGAVFLYFNVVSFKTTTAGLDVPFRYPYAFSLMLFPVVLTAALLAALWPAEAAVRASLVESLEYE
ncbi:MAG: FtsX-like permease family protein [Bryobacterales bacterium]|nr:FtsX-like permease family protein [Bryobacterales bacterium]